MANWQIGVPQTVNYNTIIHNICNSLNNASDPNNPTGVYVNITPLFANSTYKGPAGQPSIIQPPTTDNFHPNDAGHYQIASVLFSAISNFLPITYSPTTNNPSALFYPQANQTCDAVIGWAVEDPLTFNSMPTNPNSLDFYGNAPYGSAGSIFLGSTMANVETNDPGIITYLSPFSGNTTARDFSFAIPPIIRDGSTHKLYAYVIDTNKGRNSNPLVSGSPLSFTCPYVQSGGYMNAYNGSGNVTGWACQYGARTYNRVDFYDGAGFSKFLGSATANISTGDSGLLGVPQCGSLDHYFSFSLPNSIKTGQVHKIYGYIIDNSNRNQNPQIGGGPLIITF